MMKIFIGADHAGFKMKEFILKHLGRLKIPVIDCGTKNEERVDYPDFAFKVANAVSRDKSSQGILICGTGTGMMIAANKVKGIRAALIYDNYSARMAREHNDANIACLRGRKFSAKKALKIVKVWLNTEFSNAGRHLRRIRKISSYERRNALVCSEKC